MGFGNWDRLDFLREVWAMGWYRDFKVKSLTTVLWGPAELG